MHGKLQAELNDRTETACDKVDLWANKMVIELSQSQKIYGIELLATFQREIYIGFCMVICKHFKQRRFESRYQNFFYNLIFIIIAIIAYYYMKIYIS